MQCTSRAEFPPRSRFASRCPARIRSAPWIEMVYNRLLIAGDANSMQLRIARSVIQMLINAVFGSDTIASFATLIKKEFIFPKREQSKLFSVCENRIWSTQDFLVDTAFQVTTSIIKVETSMQGSYKNPCCMVLTEEPFAISS